MNFKPLSNYVLVKPVVVQEATTPSGIVLPESAVEKPNMGTIIAIGDGILNEVGDRLPMSVQVNDTILYPKFAGTEIKLNGERYLIMRDSDLFGIVSR